LTEAIIRPARLEDAGDLHRACYPEASLGDVQDYLAWCLAQERKGRILRLVAEVDGRAAGNAQLTVWGNVGEIGSLVVAEEHRRRGLARQLIAALVDEARRRELDSVEMAVHRSQPAILAFYRSLGFEIVDEKKKNGLSHSACSVSLIHLRMRLPGR
jgi:ribosomal protein S18 acetylase RimI-like enzyme